MRHSTVAAILVAVGLLGTQPPLGLVLWDGVPAGYLFTLSLVFLCIGMAGELKRELRRYNAEEEEVSLAT